MYKTRNETMGLLTTWAALAWHAYSDHIKKTFDLSSQQAFNHNRMGFRVLNTHNYWVKTNNFGYNNYVVEIHKVVLENGEIHFVCKFVGADGAVLENSINPSTFTPSDIIVESDHVWGNSEALGLESLPTLDYNVFIETAASTLNSPILNALAATILAG
jgi:hypothetical protein